MLCAQTSDDLKLHLFDSNGRLLFVKNIQSGGQSDVLLSALSDGVYFASFVSENYRKKKTVKIIKTNIQGIKGIIEMNYIYNYIVRLYYIYYYHLLSS